MTCLICFYDILVEFYSIEITQLNHQSFHRGKHWFNVFRFPASSFTGFWIKFNLFRLIFVHIINESMVVIKKQKNILELFGSLFLRNILYVLTSLFSLFVHTIVTIRNRKNNTAIVFSRYLLDLNLVLAKMKTVSECRFRLPGKNKGYKI